MAGLALGLSLQKAGISFGLYEQAPELSEVGAGIMMTPNASRALMSLGAFENVDARAQRPGATHYRDYKTGEIISTLSYDEAFTSKYNGPYLTLHRADLQLALRDTLLERSAAALHLDHQIVDVEERGNKVAAIFANGAVVEGDILVAADGVHSVIRNKILGNLTPHFRSNVAYRGMIPIDRLGPEWRTTDTSTTVGPGQHLVEYTVKKGAFLNYVAIAERKDWTEEGWSVRATPDDVRESFKGWNRRLMEMIDATPEGGLFKWGLFDRDPIMQWVKNRVVLIGDAAHPTTPFMAQGAAMSFEDAVVLGRSLEQGNTPEEALAIYERARKDRGAFVVVRSRYFGELYHAQASGDEINAERKKANDVLYPYDAGTVALA